MLIVEHIKNNKAVQYVTKLVMPSISCGTQEVQVSRSEFETKLGLLAIPCFKKEQINN